MIRYTSREIWRDEREREREREREKERERERKSLQIMNNSRLL
jgi:hypothetical protein